MTAGTRRHAPTDAVPLPATPDGSLLYTDPAALGVASQVTIAGPGGTFGSATPHGPGQDREQRRMAPAAIIHLVLFGSGKDAPWEVVGTDGRLPVRIDITCPPKASALAPSKVAPSKVAPSKVARVALSRGLGCRHRGPPCCR